MNHVVFLRSAQRDLDGIWSYIAERDEIAADRAIDRLRDAVRLLADRPLAGTDASDLLPGLRKWTVDPHLVFYIVGTGRIEIVRVVHGARDRRHLPMS